jgi:hypothetical protein
VLSGTMLYDLNAAPPREQDEHPAGCSIDFTKIVDGSDGNIQADSHVAARRKREV